MKVKKNDTVVVLTGKDAKKTGKVLVAMPKVNRVIVEGVNIQEKNHKARSAQDTSSKIKKEGAIDASNVLVICPKCNKATRVAYTVVDGKKSRTCKKCGALLDVKVDAEVKKAVKKTATKKAAAKTETEGEVKEVKKASTRKKAVKTEETAETQA